MSKDIFKDRESAEENVYFRQKDEALIRKIQEKARLAEVAQALAEKLSVDNPDLLNRIVGLGVSIGSGAAFLLLPLVEVAWADGKVSEREREAILKIAGARDVALGSSDYQQLSKWLTVRPSDAMFDTSLEAIRYGLSVLPKAEAQQRINETVQKCREVAESSGLVHKIMHLYRKGGEERTVLEHIAARLNG